MSGPTRRFIEESFPVKEVSVESAKEKNIRHGHISTLHIWWARRPLASSRATNYAALIPAPKNDNDWHKTRDFIINLCKWENSNNKFLLEKARKDILDAYGGVPPKVLDPFGGGGSIPLEALRLGCETYSNDLNPVAVLIQKCTLEYPQKYGPKLVDDVEKWGNWVLEKAREELAEFYPREKDGSVPVGFIWARTIPCQNPACRQNIPLMRQFWLAKKDKKKVSAYPIPTDSGVEFKIVGTGYDEWPDGFDAEKGTVARAVAVCPCCGSTVDAKTTRRLFQEGKSGQKMVAVVTHKEGVSGKRYRIATDKDLDVFKLAENRLQSKRDQLMAEWGMDPVPDEPTPESKGSGADRAFSVRNYGLNTWGDLFNSRQKLSLITFVEKVRLAHEEMARQGYDPEYAKAVVAYLGVLVDELARFTSVLNPWKVDAEAIVHMFGRQALPMMWDYVENNPIGHQGGTWTNRSKEQQDVLNNLNGSCFASPKTTVTQTSAISLATDSASIDAVFCDPPYYDNVPYSYLSDFFYVWLKRSIGHAYPYLLSTPLSPKKNEIVAYSEVPAPHKTGKGFFETMLRNAFVEIYRVLKTEGVAVIVYAHKTTSGWETLVNSLLDSGLIMTAAYPISTEMASRLRARDSAALASSIYIVARKMTREPTGFYADIKQELKSHLDKRLKRLWEEGIGGADFFIAAIGSAIEVFGRYEKVMDYEGNIIRASKLLDDVQEMATNYAVHEILHNGFSGVISDLTRFYVLWRWNFGEAKVPFDDARRLAQSCGIELAMEWNKHGFIVKEKEFIRVIGPDKRKIETLQKSTELVDVLHHVLLLWEKGQKDDLLKLLSDSGFAQNEVFFRVGQAVSETLPNESKEKKLLDGFLAGKERIREATKNGKTKQESMF